MDAPKNVFESEAIALQTAQTQLAQHQDPVSPLWNAFQALTHSYEKLLGDATVITNISDRLQSKLNQANETLTQQSAEIKAINERLNKQNVLLQNTIDELTKTKVGKKATTIVLVVCVLLFILSELVLDPWIEKYWQNAVIFAILTKGAIALLLQPVDFLVKNYLMRQAMRRNTAQLGEIS